MNMKNLENRILTGMAGLALAAGLAGCGTTLYVQRDGKWYDCDTSETYPSGHPCYAEVQAYKSAHASSSSSSSSSSDHEHYGGRGERDYSGRDSSSDKGGTVRCFKK